MEVTGMPDGSGSVRRRLYRAPLLVAGAVTMVVAIWGGLIRIGWAAPVPAPAAIESHGPLMVSGFLGILISLERAVGIGKGWVYAAPLMAVLFAVLTLAGTLPPGMAALPGVFAALILCAAYATVIRESPSRHLWVMAIGAACWLAGNILYALGWPVFRVVHWWAGFLVLTIVGERLELNRFLRPSPWTWPLFLAATGTVLGGYLTGLAVPAAGDRISGAGYLMLAGWLGHYDVVRHTVRGEGLPKFVAICLMSGFVWLALGGVILLGWSPLVAGPMYDAALHAIFLGFVFSMIFGHAPIIFPAILELPIRFRTLAYLPLLLLNITLALRIAGDWFLSQTLREWGALGSAAAILFYFLVTASSLRRNRPE